MTDAEFDEAAARIVATGGIIIVAICAVGLVAVVWLYA
jgi:hypothetical protein